MSDAINLVPVPRKLEIFPGSFSFRTETFIQLECPQPQDHLFTSRHLKQKLASLNIELDISASKSVPDHKIAVILRLAPESVPHSQGYRLIVQPEHILIEGHDDAGLFYGTCTLAQLIDQTQGNTLSCMSIVDWPDFPARGVMLDISRDKVPTMETLFGMIELLASWKYNEFQLYTEHTFAYQQHPEVWEKASPMTAEEILELDKFCRERFINLVPNQNSFGHMHRWFDHERYFPLGELAGTDLKNWWGKGSYSLCPIDPGSIELIASLYKELLPNFSSQLFNVGCDETFDLGLGRSKSECDRIGKGRVYLEFLKKIHDLVQSHGRTMQFWGDIIMQYPTLVPEIPTDVIALEWGYEASDPPANHCEKFASANIPFYVCPGTSSWNTIAGRTDNALGNLSTAALNGKNYGAIGYLVTDWGDNGHWQALPISYLGLAAGAAYSWCYETNRNIDIKSVLSQHAFHDSAGLLGHIAYELGNAYQVAGNIPDNASILFELMQASFGDLQEHREALYSLDLKKTQDYIGFLSKSLEQTALHGADSDLVLSEFRQTINLLEHACKRGLLFQGDERYKPAMLDLELRELMIEYQEIWLARNRIGGLIDSLARLDKARHDYLKISA